MAACPNCGRENADDARFCSACGTELAAAEPTREQRKVVTVLFCDLVGSTALGESTDPEALRARMRRYFEDLRVILERHGGTVEKFVGDAVMAVFGIPVSHEDDALRAVRAADEMRAAIAEHGLEARIGINTGEVVVGGEGETLVTGDAVNVAARLEQAAANGEVFIGAETRSLVRDAVRVEPVDPLTLKGKSEPVEAFRLVDVLPDTDGLARHPEMPLVGRERERERLWRDYEDAVADSTCRLFTLLGPAGIGKSRLVADFLDRVGDSADVLRGRCLSYGEGITYWPLVEILIAIGVEPDSVIGTSPPETQLAFRRLLESRASERPQVVVTDDVQWAEPVFVDLVEHVADFSRDAPIFLLCVARTELLDVRPGWGGGKMNATSLLLEPLGVEECADLMSRLVPDATLDAGLRERITAASAGNPLYVEEMVAMVREHGGEGEIVVPPTIHALLQARIDSLDGDVRVVMERGSVEGEVFHRGAVAELSPDPVRADVGSHLATLVRKELIRSTSTMFPADEGFRFRHLLIRDAAYESLPKATRAELHERFADWLSTHELVEGDEIVGYHLEQAYRYRVELDAGDPAASVLAGRAADQLAAAGYGAIERGDWRAARSLLQRARGLFPSGDSRRAEAAVELAYALVEAGELEAAKEAAADAVSAADPVLRARGVIADVEIRGFLADEITAESRRDLREGARVVLEEAADDLGLARYWLAAGYDGWAACQAAAALGRWERALLHAEAAGALGLVRQLEGGVVSALVLGPMPVSQALARVEELLQRARTSPIFEARVRGALGMLLAMDGRVDDGRELLRIFTSTIREAGHLLDAAASVQRFAFIERRAGGGDVERRIERVVRDGFEELERLQDRAYLPTVALELAQCLVRQERDDEARELCAIARERTLADDTVNFVYLATTEAQLAARAGQLDEAEENARHGFELAEATDFYAIRGMRSRGTLAEILSLRGKRDEAVAVAEEAVALHQAKGDVTGVAVLREQMVRAGIGVARG
jgi:class 3 adenylate cyclase/tetratricopeptide (TPR) repeat protein